MTAADVVGERFVVERRVGAGGMGAVYRAHDRVTGEPVALKRMHAGSVEAARFQRESSVLSELDHAAIVRYVAHGKDASDEPFLAMEWLDGEDLAVRLERAPLSVTEALALTARVADALTHAHGRGVIHRDIKPSNIFLVNGDPLRVKVVDFGIARPMVASRAMTATGGILGTVGYLAPEQAGAEAIDGRADIFSLGCVLFECLTGQPPFTGQHVLAILAKLLCFEPPRLRDLRPDLGAPLDELLAGMLAKQPSERMGDAAAVARALAGIGGVSRNASTSPRSTDALGDREQRVAWVLLVDFDGAPDAATARFAGVDTTPADIVARFQAQLTPLGGGALLVTLASGGEAVDKAARAALCALALRGALPDARIAMATTRAPSTGAFGMILDRAAELLARVSSPGVVVDEASLGMLEHRFELVRTDAGIALVNERDDGAEQRRLLGRATPFVGRDRELRSLCDLVDEASEDSVARVAIVTGAPGSGKSRLLEELLRARPETPSWLARADPMSARSPNAVLTRLLQDALGLRQGDAPARVRERVSERLALASDAEQAENVEFIVEALGATATPSESVRAAREHPPLMEVRIRAAFRALVAAACRDRPILVVVEDLHWGDLPSVHALDHVLAELRDRPLIVLASGRPELRGAFPDLWSTRTPQRIELPELTSRAAGRIVRGVLGGAANAELVDRVVARAAGNPLVLEELVRIAATGSLDDVPDTLHAIVQGRLEQESPDDRRLLRAASIFGETFWAGGAAALTAAAEPQVLERLRALVDREWLLLRDGGRFAGSVELAFRHALVRDATYAMLTDEDRALGHGLAAAWLERAGEVDAMTIADHLERAGRLREACRWHVAGAQSARRSNDLDAVLEHAKRGIACGADGEQLGALRLAEGDALFFRGDFAGGLESVVEASAHLVPGTSGWSDAVGWRALTASLIHDPAPALEAVEILVPVEPAEGASVAYARAALYVLASAYFAGARGPAERVLAAAERSADARDPRAVGWLEFARAMSARVSVGDVWADRMHCIAAATAFEQGGDTLGTAFILSHCAMAECKLGAFDEARGHVEEAARVTERFGLRLLSAFPLALRAILGAQAGEADAGERADDALQVARSLPDEMYGSYASLMAAKAVRMVGDAARAELIAREVLSQVKLWGLRTMGLGELAAALLDQGRTEEALLACQELHLVGSPARLVGLHDLEYRAVAVRAMERAGNADGAAQLATRAARHIQKLAITIPEPSFRARFLATSPCVELMTMAAKSAS